MAKQKNKKAMLFGEIWFSIPKHKSHRRYGVGFVVSYFQKTVVQQLVQITADSKRKEKNKKTKVKNYLCFQS